MIFVDPKNPKPLYEQIQSSVRVQLMRGILLPHDKLPSVREFAQSAAINPNTIQKAYRELEAEGYVYCLPGRGCFVSEISHELKRKRIQEIMQMISPLVEELTFLGVDKSEIESLLKGRVNNVDD